MSDWWDTNGDGHLDGFERDRYEYENGFYPGQPEGYWYDYEKDDEPHESDRERGSSFLDSIGENYDGSDADDDFDDDEDDENDDGWSLDDEDDDDDDPEYGIIRDENRCTSCLYWRDEDGDWLREYGCRIFHDFVTDNFPGVDGSARPDADKETCKWFHERPGCVPSCFECAHYTGDADEHRGKNFALIVDAYCDIWSRVRTIAADTMYKDPDGHISFTVICPEFEIRNEKADR